MIVRRFRCTANERSPDLAIGASLVAGGSDNFPSVRMLASISYQIKKPRREGPGLPTLAAIDLKSETTTVTTVADRH